MAILPDRSALTTPADGDLYMTTDVSDTTDAATGTDKKITWANMKAAITTVGTLSAGNADAVVSNASSTTAGKVELATATELLSETDTGRALTPASLSAYAGGANITHVGTLSAGNVDAAVTNSSSTAAGKVELATAAELVTGTDTGRAVTPGGMSAYAGGTNITKVGTLSAGNVNAAVTAATTSTAGKVELAIASEVNTGTDATRAVTPDALAGSNFGIRLVQAQVVEGATDCATGDGAGNYRLFIPQELNGMNLVSAHAACVTAGTTGTMDVQIHNVTDAADMLSTKITIDSGEKTSYTAATAPVINTAADDVATGDELRIDVDAVHTTAAKGLSIILGFQLP